MKKIPVMTIVLVVVLALNVTVMIITGINLKGTNSTKKYVPSLISSENGNYSTTTYYEVKKGDIAVYDYFDGSIAYKENAFDTYKIDNASSLKMFDEVLKDETIGSYSSADVKALYDGKIVSISNDEDGYEVEIFNYESAYITMQLDYYSYYYMDFENSRFSVVIGEKEYALTYDSVNLESTTSSTLNVNFKIEDNNVFLSEGYGIQVRKENKIYKNVFYLEDCYALTEDTQRTFFYVEDGEVKHMEIYCSYSSYGTLIISGDNLKAGMKIYD